MLALNILLDAPGEFGCLQDSKTKLAKSLAFFLSGIVVGRRLGQLAGLRFQSCSQLVEQPLTLVMKGLDWEMLSAHQPLEHSLALKGRDHSICFRIISAVCHKCWFPATWTNLLDQNLGDWCPRICISKNRVKLFICSGMLEELQGRENQGLRGRLTSVHLWPGQLFTFLSLI